MRSCMVDYLDHNFDYDTVVTELSQGTDDKLLHRQ